MVLKNNISTLYVTYVILAVITRHRNCIWQDVEKMAKTVINSACYTCLHIVLY